MFTGLRNKADQSGFTHILLLIAGIGILAFIFIISIAPFRSRLFSSLFPTQYSMAATDEWTQDGHDAQRTGTTSEEPTTPWTFAWSFNGPDANGSAAGHFQDAPSEARTVTGGANIYAPLGSRGLFALRKNDGSTAWNITQTAFNAAPAYDPTTQTVIAGGNDGNVYKIDATSGSVIATYNAGSPVNKSVLLSGGFAYVVTNTGQLHKIDLATMTGSWVYSAGSAAQTPASYSPSRDAIVFATADLNVHAVNNSNGTIKWKVKPTPNAPGFPNEFNFGWPVIAERHGIVFLRMRLNHNAMDVYPGTNGIFPTSLSTTRSWLIANPQYKNLFALNLDDGTEKFIPAVGYGSTEDYLNGSAYGTMGSQPIIKVYPDGSEVAYIHFRNGQSNPPDFRWDSHMGEMVLDDTTIPGLAAGDLRFVKMSNFGGQGGPAYTHITDEQTPLSMAGNMLFNAHWAASVGVKILDRAASKGLSFADPITSQNLPTVIRAVQSCANFNAVTHYTTCHLSYVTDGGRFFNGPGFWGYWNVADPPGWRVGSGNTAGTAYSAGFLPRYTYVSDGQMIVEGNGGELLVFEHSGTISQPTPSPSSTVLPSPSAVPSAAPSVAPQTEIIDSTDVKITFNGWFPTTSNSSMYGGSERAGEFGGTTASMSFIGNSVTLIYTQNTDRGQASITIDGAVVDTIDQYGPLEYQKEKTYPLGQGSHTITITVNRAKQTASTGYFVGVDAFKITQQAQASPSQSPSPSPLKIGDISGITGSPDGVVNIWDYNQMLTDFGSTDPNSISNIEKAGTSANKVDIFDYNLLLTNFGQ